MLLAQGIESLRVLFLKSAHGGFEIHAGSGYWSQDSAVLILGAEPAPDAVWVRWPGGKTTTASLPSNAQEVRIDPTGKLEVLRTTSR